MIKLKDAIQYYIGCRVLIDDKEYGTLIGGDFISNSVDQIYYSIITDEAAAKGDDFHMPYNDDTSEECRIKPILRKLEDITDEEIKELIGWDKITGIYVNVSFTKVKGGIDISYGIDAEDGGAYMESYHISFYLLTPEQLVFFTKNGFDMFNFINRGLAIDKKQFSQIEK